MTTLTQRPPWTSKYKPNWDEAYQRMMAWWDGSSLDRPVVLNAIAKPGRAPLAGPATLPDWERADLDADFQMRHNSYHIEQALYPAEAVPHLWTRYGNLLCMLSSMAGAPTHYRSHAIWIGEVENLFERPLPEFDADNPAYAFAIRMIHQHARQFGYDAVLGANPMLDPLTTLSMMRGSEQLCIDLMDQPEMVKRWTTRLGDLFLQIVQGYRAARAQYGRREDFNWCGVWAPGDMDALQCDFSTMLSPAMFKEFALPELERQAAFMDYGLWHLDGEDEFPHVEAICAVKGMRAIQWVDAQYRPQMEFIDIWRKIRGLGKSIIVSHCSLDQAVELTCALGRDGLAFDLFEVNTEKDMDVALKCLRDA